MKKILSIIMSMFLITLFSFAYGCGEQPVEPNEPEQETFYYTVTLNLDYVIPCTYRNKTSSDLATIKVAKDGRISDLTLAVPIGNSEYEFSYWEFEKNDGTKYKITSTTKFTVELFGDEKNVTINAICVSNFTPRA